MNERLQDNFTGDDGMPDRFTLLVLRYLDDQLEDDERAELNEALRDEPALRRRFLDHCTQTRLIREMLRAGQPAKAAVAAMRVRRSAPPAARVKLARVRLVGAIAAAVVITALVTGLVLTRPGAGVATTHTGAHAAPPRTTEPAGPLLLASLETVTGAASLEAPGASSRAAHAGAPIRAGETVRLKGPDAKAEVAYADGTRILLVGSTSATFPAAAGKFVTVPEGTLFVSAAPQPPGTPMLLATAAAQVEVLGTRLALTADDTRTEVRVSDGRVRLTRSADGRSVDVPHGKSTVASKAAAREALAVRDIPQPPDTWEADFEDGLPDGFERGLWVTGGLPRGSRGAVRAGPVDKRHLGEEGVYYDVISPEYWYDGMFAVHEDTHVHFTFRMEKPDWVNVFIMARSPGPPRAYEINYLFNDLRFWPPEAGKWRTVSIPVSKFKRLAGPRGTGVPFENEVPYRMLFSSLGDRGLVIDRVWVTRGGPGVVTYSDVP